MKRIVYFIILLVLCLLPVQVFAAPSETEVQEILQKFGLAPGVDSTNSGVFRPENYDYNGDKLEQFKIYNVGLTISLDFSANLGEHIADVADCDDIYGEVMSASNGVYKISDYKGCIVGSPTWKIKYDTFNTKYKELYGTDAPKRDAFLLESKLYEGYQYNQSINSYVRLVNTIYNAGSTDGSNSMLFTIFKIRSIEETEDDLKVIVTTQKIVSEDSKINLNSREITIDGTYEEVENELYNNYIDEMNKYTVTLTKNGSSYVFKSINKIVEVDDTTTEEIVNVDDTAAFSTYSLYILGIATLLIGAFLWLFARKSTKIIKEV